MKHIYKILKLASLMIDFIYVFKVKLYTYQAFRRVRLKKYFGGENQY